MKALLYYIHATSAPRMPSQKLTAYFKPAAAPEAPEARRAVGQAPAINQADLDAAACVLNCTTDMESVGTHCTQVVQSWNAAHRPQEWLEFVRAADQIDETLRQAIRDRRVAAAVYIMQKFHVTDETVTPIATHAQKGDAFYDNLVDNMSYFREHDFGLRGVKMFLNSISTEECPGNCIIPYLIIMLLKSIITYI